LHPRHIAGRWALALAIIGPSTCAAQTVFVSIPPQAWLAKQLAGNLIRVEILLPPGASPATYEPTPRQMAMLERSQLYLQIGAPFEGTLLAKVADLMPEVRVVDCRVGVRLEPIEGQHQGHGGQPLDPHIWLDPRRMKLVAQNSAEALQELLPDRAQEIEQRLFALVNAIDATDHRVNEILAPHAGSTLLVFHPAYGYFTRRYGLIQTAIEVEGKAPSARRMATIVDGLRQHKVPALFVQPQFSRTTAERVATALDCDLVELDPLAGDYLANLETMAARIAEALH
jgi:zinc transport system substrate-binding protein